MVIGQIAGIGTAFGTGELSGAGFGPNYTILMKIGYEFYAPRIIEEMHKNPKMHFQDTVYWKQFQVSIKLYSDQVIKETLQTLLDIPDATIAAIDRKLSGRTADETTPIQQVSHILQQSNALELDPGETTVQEGGQRYHIRGTPMFLTFNIMPNLEKILAGGLNKFNTGGTTQQQTLSPDTELKTEQTATGLSLSLFAIRNWRFQDLNNAMSAITKGNSLYSNSTQTRIRTEWMNRKKESKSQKTQQQQQLLQKQQQTNVDIDKIISTGPSKFTQAGKGFKKKAGQSIKIERTRLIQEIAKFAKWYQSWKDGLSKGQIANNAPNKAKMNGYLQKMQFAQKQLAKLLTNYDFT